MPKLFQEKSVYLTRSKQQDAYLKQKKKKISKNKLPKIETVLKDDDQCSDILDLDQEQRFQNQESQQQQKCNPITEIIIDDSQSEQTQKMFPTENGSQNNSQFNPNIDTIDFSMILQRNNNNKFNDEQIAFNQLNLNMCKNKKIDPIEKYFSLKICEVCRVNKDDDLLLLCDYCDDAYHTYCCNPQLKSVPNDDFWMCQVCKESKEKSLLNSKKKQSLRQTYLDEHFQVNENSKEQFCKKCEKCIQAFPSQNKRENQQQDKLQKEFCIKCQNYFHNSCFGQKKKNAIICLDCEKDIKKKTPKTNQTLLKFFQPKIFNQQQEQNQVQKVNVNHKRKKKINMQKKKVGFKLPKFSEESSQQCKQSLFFALQVKNIEFSDDLRYDHSDCQQECNNADLYEPQLQKLEKQQADIFNSFKQMSRRGDYAPVIVEQDKIQGFIVKAHEDIPKYTLISEYVGQVDFARNHIFDKNDSIMDLLRTTRSKTSLVICPDKFGNLARFLSGINNFDNSKQKKQNVQSIRFCLNGQARVVLYAKKDIKKGDILYYDYNEGGFDEYPTEEFI